MSCAIASCNNTKIITKLSLRQNYCFLENPQKILFPKLNCRKTQTLFPSFETFSNKIYKSKL